MRHFPEKRNLYWVLIGLIFLGALFFLFREKVCGDDAGEPFSVKSRDTIGAWYDETWEAAAFYRTMRVAGTDTVKYSQTYEPLTSDNPTCSVLPSVSSPQQGEKIIPGSNISSDMTVTEWKVTGHLHFKSGL